MIGGDDDERLARQRSRADRTAGRARSRSRRPRRRTGRSGSGARTPPAAGTARADRRRAPSANHLAGLRADPVERGRDDRVGAALRQREVDGAAGFADPVVVDVEAGVQTEALIEREPADERAGREAERLQPRRQRVGLRLDPIAVVVADAVLVGIGAGQDAGVRRQRDDGVRVREGEARAARGERVEVRRAGAAAVGRQRIGAQRVDGDEEDVAVRIGRDDEPCGATVHHADRRGERHTARPPTTSGLSRAARGRGARAVTAASARFGFDRRRPVGRPNMRHTRAAVSAASRRGDVTHEIGKRALGLGCRVPSTDTASPGQRARERVAGRAGPPLRDTVRPPCSARGAPASRRS